MFQLVNRTVTSFCAIAPEIFLPGVTVKKPQIITKFPPFLKGNLAQNLASISNSKCKHK